jgi:hypothetical protein
MAEQRLPEARRQQWCCTAGSVLPFPARRICSVVKYYFALTSRRPARKQGSVVGDMRRARAGAWRLSPQSAGTDDPAVTRFASVGVPAAAPGLRAFLLRPETGRTHQLRVALKSLSSPVLGDELYGRARRSSSSSSKLAHSSRSSNSIQHDAAGLPGVVESLLLAPDRMYLHAAGLRLALPSGGCLQVVEPPSEGELFLQQDVAAALELLLPRGLADDLGTWLGSSKLMRSDAPDSSSCNAAASEVTD